MWSVLFPFNDNLLNVTAQLAVLSVVSWIWSRVRARGLKVDGKHVFISGGSTGLGLSLAVKLAQAGAKVTVAARTQSKLDDAIKTISAVNPKHKPFSVSCDVTNYHQVQAAVKKATQAQGESPDMIICNAGTSLPGYFIESSIESHRQQMELNYFGCLHVVKAVVDDMVKRRSGHIVLVSSGVAFSGFVGYAQYSPSKFALRGLSDCLRNELLAHNIKVTIYFPSSMDTPGFAEENMIKPIETKEIEGSASVFTADQAADHLLQGIALGQYSISEEVLTELGRMGTNGPAPRNNTALELLLSPLLVLFSLGFRFWMDHVVKSHAKKKPKRS